MSTPRVSIEWNGSVFVLTQKNQSDGNTIYKYSQDGTNWDSANVPTSLLTNNTAFVSKWVGDRFLVAGNLATSGVSGNCCLSSPDGVNYSITKMKNGVAIQDVETNLEYTNTIVFPRTINLAVGIPSGNANSSTISYSLDNGDSWNPSVSSGVVFPGGATQAVWNGKIWVAVGSAGTSGEGNTIATSYNGIDWMGRGKYIFSGKASGVAWSKQQTRWVAVGSSVVAAYSSDGVYWLETQIPGFSEANSIGWNGQLWVAAGTPVDGNAQSIAYSSDGQSWTSVSAMFSIKATAVEWNGTYWSVFGQDPTYNLATSADGIHWKIQVVSGTPSPKPFYNQTYFLSESSGNTYLRSIDSQNWESRSTVSDMSLSLVSGFTWNSSNEAVANILPLSIATGEGANTLGFSLDGIFWTGLGSSVFSTRANRAAWNGRLWAAVGTCTTEGVWVATSYDGYAWTVRESTYMIEGYDIAWNGHLFVAVGRNASGGAIATSPDGIHWNPIANISSLFSSRVSAVVWTGRIWIVYGSGGNTTAESFDGNTWTSSHFQVVSDASSVFWQSGYLSGSSTSATASSTQTGYEAYRAFDNTNTTDWRSADGNYSGVGAYVGEHMMVYNTSTPAQGEWIQLSFPAAVNIKRYSVAFNTTDSTAIPKHWILLGSNDETTWSFLHEYQFDSVSTPPNNGWNNSPCILPINLDSNTANYSYYRIVVEQTFGAGYAAITELDLFMDNGNTATLDIREKPVLLRNHMVFMNRYTAFSGVAQPAYRLADLSGVAQLPLNSGKYVSTTLYGMGAKQAISSTCFDGEHLFIADVSGNVAYLSNDAANGNLNFDISYNGNVIDSRLSAIYGSCWNQRFVLFCGEEGITYGRLEAGWTPTNANQLFTRVNGVASNSGYGPTYIQNVVYLREGDTLRVVGPKAYTLPGETSLQFQLYNQ